MAWVWTAVGVVGLVAGALTFAVAALVHFAGPGKPQNRLLAAMLVLMAAVIVGGFALTALSDDPATVIGWQASSVVPYGPYLALYLVFLSTIPTPLAPTLTRARPAFLLFGALVPLSYFLWREHFLLGVEPGGYQPWLPIIGPAWALVFYISGVIGLFGLVVAVLAFLRSRKGSLRRAQATAYLAAFATLDLAQGGVNVFFAWTGSFDSLAALYVQLAGITIFPVLLAYGMLKTQLFDIDIKLKWTLSRGTLAAAFLIVFLVVSQFIERVASEKLGYASGAIAAGLMLFAINPLQRTADKLADKAMPRTDSSAAYVAFRKMEVYKAAVEELAVGGITPKERRALNALREKLGVGAAAATQMEHDIVRTRGVA